MDNSHSISLLGKQNARLTKKVDDLGVKVEGLGAAIEENKRTMTTWVSKIDNQEVLLRVRAKKE